MYPMPMTPKYTEIVLLVFVLNAGCIVGATPVRDEACSEVHISSDLSDHEILPKITF